MRIHPFPTLLAQAIQLASFAIASPIGAAQVLAKSSLVFSAMALECAATSCLELATIPKQAHGKIDRTLSVIDKFDMLHWLATRKPLNRGHQFTQMVDDLVSARNELVHARVKRKPIGASRKYSVGEQIEAGYDNGIWNALRIPKDERSWTGQHATIAAKAAVEFMNYFFLDACMIEQSKLAVMLFTSSGDIVFRTPWESEVLTQAEKTLGLKLRFLGL